MFFLQELATLTDFDYLKPEADLDFPLEDLMFQKLFYSTAVCTDQSGLQFRLRRFARKVLVVETEEETGDKHVVCRWVNSVTAQQHSVFISFNLSFRTDNS